jgi:hypothetical protein
VLDAAAQGGRCLLSDVGPLRPRLRARACGAVWRYNGKLSRRSRLPPSPPLQKKTKNRAALEHYRRHLGALQSSESTTTSKCCYGSMVKCLYKKLGFVIQLYGYAPSYTRRGARARPPGPCA